MEKRTEIPASWKHSLTTVAAHMAIFVGIAWSASFLCSMYGLKGIWLSSLGNLIVFYSFFMITSNVRNYRSWIKDIKFGRCWLLAFYICIFAALITSAVQYAYFTFLDKGRLMSVMLEMAGTPEYQQAMQQIMPGVEMQQIMALFEGMTVRSIMSQLMTFNFLICIPISLITGLIGSWGIVKKDESVHFIDDEK